MVEGERVRLGDLVEIKHGWPFRSREFSESLTGRPIVVAVGNFRYTGGFRFAETTVKEYLSTYPVGYELQPDDILLVMTCQTAGGEILGIPAKIPDDGRVYLHNQRLGKVVVRDDAPVDRSYLYWVFLRRDFNAHLVASASGTKILHTAPSRIEEFEFDLPPLSDQLRIGSILNALDDKIELNRQMNGTLEAMARALFRDWFGDFGPTRAKMEDREPYLAPDLWALFPDSLDDEDIPAGWESKPLDQIAEFLNGLALQKFPPSDASDSLPVIKIAELRNGISERSNRASRDVPEKYIVDDGDFLFSWSGSLLAKFWTEGEGALNQHLFKVTSERYPAWFYSQWVHHYLEEFQAIAAAKATTMGHIQRSHLTESVTICPPDDVLATLGQVVGPLVERMINNDLESQTLTATRDVLLPKLMSGELRLEDAEKAVGAVA